MIYVPFQIHCIIRSWYFQEIAVKSIDIDGLFYPCNPAKAILPPDISDWELRFYFWSWRAFCKVAGPRLKHLVVRFISWVGCPGCDAENWGYSNSLILFVSLDITKPNLGSKSLQTHRGVKWCKYVGMFPWLAVHTSPFFWTWEFFVANLTAQQRITERRQSRSVSKSQVSQRKSTRHARRKREQKPATGSRCSVFFKISASQSTHFWASESQLPQNRFKNSPSCPQLWSVIPWKCLGPSFGFGPMKIDTVWYWEGVSPNFHPLSTRSDQWMAQSVGYKPDTTRMLIFPSCFHPCFVCKACFCGTWRVVWDDVYKGNTWKYQERWCKIMTNHNCHRLNSTFWMNSPFWFCLKLGSHKFDVSSFSLSIYPNIEVNLPFSNNRISYRL